MARQMRMEYLNLLDLAPGLDSIPVQLDRSPAWVSAAISIKCKC